MARHGAPKWEASAFAPVRRMSSADRTRERAAQQAHDEETERDSRKLSRFMTIDKLQRYLESRGFAEPAERVIAGVSERDPWKYESALLDDLISIRSGNDPELLSKLRDLIWIGSVTTYERMQEDDVLKELNAFGFLLHMKQRQEEAKRVVPAVLDREEARALKRRIDAIHDPATYEERHEEEQDISRELQAVKDAITNKLLGDELEPAVRVIENLQFQNWHALQANLAVHGKRLSDVLYTRGANGAASPDVERTLESIEDLRHVRDLLYYRRNHPDWAQFAISGRRKKD